MEKQQLIQLANKEEFAEIVGRRTGKSYEVRKFVYGVLVPDHEHPLSTVSVSNSSLSIDIWTGCAFQCAYCHVQGSEPDLIDNGAMAKKPVLRSKFSIDEIVDALVIHPFFQRDRSVISIGTASTEPFAPGPVAESTFQIMRAFIDRGFKNPFWIVTKAGVPKGYKQQIAEIAANCHGLHISICWADNPPSIEPAQANRFRYCADAKEAGATIGWYLRPIVPEWAGTPERIEMMMLWVAERYGNMIDAIVPGGLRWTEGIEYGLTEVNDLPMPNIPMDDNVKALPEEIWETIMRLGESHFPGVPVYRRSSCALTHALKVPSITSVNVFAAEDCENSHCPAAQRMVCAKSPMLHTDAPRAQRILDELGVTAKVLGIGGNRLLITEPPLSSFTYAIRRTVEKRLALEDEPA